MVAAAVSRASRNTRSRLRPGVRRRTGDRDIDVTHLLRKRESALPAHPTTAAQPAQDTGNGRPARHAGFRRGIRRSARQEGAAPLHVGDPGYRPGLDRDGDGVACE
ncbi:MAG TPA: excalibur calcium-binding domain-containing protein [Kineosporiaceae bacterium]|nr:excalibur calcium-binding domain-containing protein [Kineosporiaceae bacterium]